MELLFLIYGYEELFLWQCFSCNISIRSLKTMCRDTFWQRYLLLNMSVPVSLEADEAAKESRKMNFLKAL